MWSWILAYRNLGRNKRRSLATGLAICAGFIGLLLISAYLHRSQRALQASTIYLNHKGHLALFKKNSLHEFTYRPSKFLITQNEQKIISNLLKSHETDIEFTGKYLTGSGLITSQSKSTPFIATAVEPEVYSKILHHPEVNFWAPDWVYPETIKNSHKFISNASLVSITEPMGEMIGKAPPFTQYNEDERTIQLIAKSFFGDLNVVDAEIGLKHTTGIALAEDTSLYLGLSQLQSLYATDGIQYWSLFLNDTSSMKRLRADLQKKLDDINLNIDVVPFDDSEWGAYYVGSLGFLYVIGCFFVVLICGAVILSVVNTTTLGIFERHKEIGTLRATGFPPKAIYALFWKENCILSLLALGIGYILAEWIAFLVNAANIKFQPPGTQGEVSFILTTNFSLTLTLAILVLVINFISTIVAVRKTTKTPIVNLLTASGG